MLPGRSFLKNKASFYESSPNESKVMKKNDLIVPELVVMGAGPGDPELITVKAYKALQRADVILYDNLASKELLTLASDQCEKVYVGKKPYESCTSQEKIHQLIKHFAFSR